MGLFRVVKIKSRWHALFHTIKMELSDIHQSTYDLAHSVGNQIANKGCKYLSRTHIQNL